jgi:hypothetical protein
MRSKRPPLIGLGLWSASVLCFLSGRAFGDQIEMQNGDHYVGTVLTLNSNYVVLQSDVLGTVKLPRAKVAAVNFGAKAEAKEAKPTTSKMGDAAAAANRGTNGTSATAQALRHLGAHTNLIHQVEDKFLKDAGPEAKAKFDELMQGLMSGNMDLQGIRTQACEAVNQIKALKRDGGDQLGAMLDTYQAILEKFIKETTPPAGGAATNTPSGLPSQP